MCYYVRGVFLRKRRCRDFVATVCSGYGSRLVPCQGENTCKQVASPRIDRPSRAPQGAFHGAFPGAFQRRGHKSNCFFQKHLFYTSQVAGKSLEAISHFSSRSSEIPKSIQIMIKMSIFNFILIWFNLLKLILRIIKGFWKGLQRIVKAANSEGVSLHCSRHSFGAGRRLAPRFPPPLGRANSWARIGGIKLQGVL